MNARQHAEADQILKKLRQERISSLYHFTSIENLPLIRDMGALCSKKTLEEAGSWPPPVPGGNDLSQVLDRNVGNWDKLSLNFTPHTPMAYRKKPQSHLCFFVIGVEVAALSGVLFTNTNAAAGGRQRRGEGINGLGLVDFAALRSAPRPWDREGWVWPVQAEALVPGQVSLDYIKEVGFVSEASLQEAERLWGRASGPPFRVEPRYFRDSPYGGTVPLSFPYLVSAVLTDDRIDGSTVSAKHLHKSRFLRGPNVRVTLLASVRVLAGSEARMTWNPGDHVAAEQFEKSDEYWHWPSILTDELPLGHCSVEYRLGSVRWATINFELVSG